MSEVQAGEATRPITLIGQVKRFDVIKMLEKASTRLFHNGSQIHAAELAQAALFLRQPPEEQLSQEERDGWVKVQHHHFGRVVFETVKATETRDGIPLTVNFSKPDELAWAIAHRFADQRGRRLTLEHRVAELEEKLRAANRRARAKSSKKSKGRRK